VSDWNLPWEGGCRCGKVRVRVTAPPLLTMACHCTGCQRMSASAFSLSIAIPTPGFAVKEGEPVIGGLHGDARHFFCSWCKSWMFTRMEGLDDFVNLRVPVLDDRSWVVPFVETCTAEKFAWAETGAVHSFPKFPAMEDFPRLIEDFAARGMRPSM
jgi:hypothetical protein